VSWPQTTFLFILLCGVFSPRQRERDPLATVAALAILFGVIVIGVVALTLGASTQGPRALRLAVGMSPEEVTAALGEPSTKARASEFDVWVYPDGIRLKFQDGRLTEWRVPAPQGAPGPPPGTGGGAAPAPSPFRSRGP
jgi:hypothetical protein